MLFLALQNNCYCDYIIGEVYDVRLHKVIFGGGHELVVVVSVRRYLHGTNTRQIDTVNQESFVMLSKRGQM
jgi:hypothetical protein